VRWVTILMGLGVASSSWAQPAVSPAPAAAAPGAPAAANPGAPPSAGDAQTAYTVKLHDLERRVDELKEQVFRSKARLNLLKETVLHGVIAGAHAVILYRNEIGSMYTPIQYVYSLDGNEIYAKVDETGKLSDQKEFEIFNGSLAPGNHTMSVRMVYVGNGYGVFSYLKGYRFNVNSSRTFTASEGKQFQLKVVGHEKGNMLTTDMKDRLDVAYRENVIQDKDKDAKDAKPQAQAKK
jgi:hypothetical protein